MVGKAWGRLSYVAYLCAALIAVNFVVHYFHIENLRNRSVPDKTFDDFSMGPELARQLGGVTNWRSNFYTNFPTTKPPGTVRIGCFGDSFTAGSEVGNRRDFPTLLQQIFDFAGLRQVEVINFGIEWTGFHQAYMVWDYVGRHYDLDYILVGPLGFLPARDLRFNHAGGGNPYYLHSRFVLQQDGVKRTDVIGNTFEERFEAYHGFVPALRYLRYDRSPPAFLAALLPTGRTLRNPFYYTDKSEEDEARATWLILMERMAESAIPIIVGNYRSDAVQTAIAVDRPNVAGRLFGARFDFPYKAPQQHNSPMGNLRVARQFFASLTGDSRPIPFIELEDLPELRVPPRASAPLDSFASLELSIGGKPLGRFGEYQDTRPDYLKRHQIKTLLAIRQRGQSWLTGFFVGLPFEVTDQMVRDAQLPMQQPDPNLAIWVIDVDRAVRIGRGSRTLRVTTISTDMLDTLELGGQKWFEAGPAGDDGLSLLTTRTPEGWLSVSADPNTLIDENTLGDNGVVHLVLKRPGKAIRFPIARWHRKSEPPPRSLEQSLLLTTP